jgi:hypothetical protein
MDATGRQRAKSLLRESGRGLLSSSTSRSIAQALETRGSSDINEESFIVKWKPAAVGESDSESDSLQTAKRSDGVVGRVHESRNERQRACASSHGRAA